MFASEPALAPRRGIAATMVEPRLLRFTTLLFAAAIFLQRLGLPFGGKPISLVGPVGLALAFYAWLTGALVLNRARLAVFGLLVGWICLGTALHQVLPGRFGVGPSLQSMAQFVVLSAFAVLGFAQPVPEQKFFARIGAVLAILAVCGIAQFALQFVGLGLFQFQGILPDWLLYEIGYDQVIPVGVGDILKSNGFFLEEPSIFSQFMALGIMLEALGPRRPWRFALFAAGLLLSFSGTGWIVLLVFVATVGARLGARGVAIALGTAVALALAIGAMLWLAPDLAAALQDRFSEFSTPGTSGHLRFVTPFWAAADVWRRDALAPLFGIGAGVSERLSLPYEYDVNTPVKIVLEYGIPALAAYLALYLVARRTPAQGALLPAIIALVLAAGGYQEFPPVLFPMLLLSSIARLAPQSGPQVRHRAAARAQPVEAQ